MRILIFAVLFLQGTIACEDENGTTVESFFSKHENFFDSDSAATTFREPPKITSNPEFGVFNPEKARKTLLEKIKEEREKKQKEGMKANAKNDFRSREEIIEAFGKPDDLKGKLPLESLSPQAPDSLKGLVAALNVGDELLAEEYASAYADYLAKLQSYFTRINKLTELQQKARKGELSDEELASLPKGLLSELKKPGVESVDISLDEIRNLLTQKEDSLNEIKEVLEDEFSSLSIKIASQDPESAEAIAKNLIAKHGIFDKSFDLLIVLNPPTSQTAVKAGKLISNVLTTGEGRSVAPKLICVPSCNDNEKNLVNLIVGTQLPFFSSSKIANQLNVKDSIEYLLVGKESGKVLRFNDTSSEILRNIVKLGSGL